MRAQFDKSRYEEGAHEWRDLSGPEFIAWLKRGQRAQDKRSAAGAHGIGRRGLGRWQARKSTLPVRICVCRCLCCYWRFTVHWLWSLAGPQADAAVAALSLLMLQCSVHAVGLAAVVQWVGALKADVFQFNVSFILHSIALGKITLATITCHAYVVYRTQPEM